MTDSRRTASPADVPNPDNVPLWHEDPRPSRRPRLDGDGGTVEVAVIGAGITGLSTALMLSFAGVEVALVEAERVGMGASGYNTGKASAQHGLKYATLEKLYGEEGARLYAKGNRDAVEQIVGMLDKIGHDADIVRCASHVYTRDPDEVDTLERELAAARRAGLDYELVRETELPFEVAASLRLPDQVRLDPRKLCLGFLEGFEQRGGTVYEDSRVRAFDKQDGAFVLTTDTGTLRARKVVIATLLPFLDRAGFFARTRGVRSYCVALEQRGAPLQEMYISTGSPTRSLRAAQGGDILVVGGEGHDVGDPHDTRERYETLERFGREHFDVGELVATWSTQDYQPADKIPFIGQMPLTPDGVYTACGYDKWGLSAGVLAGNILMHAITGKHHPCAELFDARRVNLVRSAPELVKDGLHFSRHFVSDRFRHLVDRRKPADLAPGQGAVVHHGARMVAAYRDDAGALHMVSPVCTHMGCHVNWNPAERTWDCPCHASRFGTDGRVLQGPATADLKPIDTDD